MDHVDEQVAGLIAAFEQDRDVTRIYEALDVVEAAERDVPLGDAPARRQSIARRLRFLAALDAYIDPRWDAASLPVLGAPPPPSHQGMVYGSGEVDPRDIADQTERAEYERTLRANREYAAWYDAQDQLRRIDERAVRFLALLLTERYGDTPAERQEFERLLTASPLSEARMVALRALFPGSE